MAKIMVVAGGEWQCPLVKTIKNMGHYVVCTNLYKNSPAFSYADVGVVADVLDKEKNLEIAKKYNVDAVVTDQSDIAVPTVAYVAEKLNLRGIGASQAELFTNKYLMREFCKKNDFAYPKYRLCYNKEEVESFAALFPKVVIKPINGQSSRGISVIYNGSDIEQCFNKAITYSSGKDAVIVEEFLEGVEFTVDGLRTKDGYESLAVSKKRHYSYNPSIAKELYFENYDEQYDYDELRKLNKELVLKMDLPFGLTHAEYKYMNGKYYLIEIGARGGGTKISSDIVPHMSGVNSNEILINTLLGEDVKYDFHYDKNKCAVLGFFDFKAGKVSGISGIEDAKQLDGVVSLVLNFNVGDYITEAQDDRTRIGHYIILSETRESLREIEEKLKEIIKIYYE